MTGLAVNRNDVAEGALSAVICRRRADGALLMTFSQQRALHNIFAAIGMHERSTWLYWIPDRALMCLI